MPFSLILWCRVNLFLSVLVLFSCCFGLFSANDELGIGDAFTVSSFSYPETRLGPFDLRYIRGERTKCSDTFIYIIIIICFVAVSWSIILSLGKLIFNVKVNLWENNFSFLLCLHVFQCYYL